MSGFAIHATWWGENSRRVRIRVYAESTPEKRQSRTRSACAAGRRSLTAGFPRRAHQQSKLLKPLQLLHHRVSVFHLTTILTTVFVAHFCSHNWLVTHTKNRISLANTAFQDQCKCAIFEKKTPQKHWKRWRQLCKSVHGLNVSVWVFGGFTKNNISHQMLILRHLLATSIHAYPSGSENPGFKPIKALTRFV